MKFGVLKVNSVHFSNLAYDKIKKKEYGRPGATGRRPQNTILLCIHLILCYLLVEYRSIQTFSNDIQKKNILKLQIKL